MQEAPNTNPKTVNIITALWWMLLTKPHREIDCHLEVMEADASSRKSDFTRDGYQVNVMTSAGNVTQMNGAFSKY